MEIDIRTVLQKTICKVLFIYICNKSQCMRTNIVLKKEELTPEFLNHIKGMFKDADELRISIAESEDFDLYQEETKDEYFDRLERAMNEMEDKKVSFKEEEFFKMARDSES